MKTQYFTASSLDGFIATEDDSLDWLFPLGDINDTGYPRFIAEVGALAMGSATSADHTDFRHTIGHRIRRAALSGTQTTMTSHKKHTDAYEQGRQDAAHSERSGAAAILAALATGMTAHLTSLKNVRYNPPSDEAARAEYDRGWRDAYGA